MAFVMDTAGMNKRPEYGRKYTKCYHANNTP